MIWNWLIVLFNIIIIIIKKNNNGKQKQTSNCHLLL